MDTAQWAVGSTQWAVRPRARWWPLEAARRVAGGAREASDHRSIQPVMMSTPAGVAEELAIPSECEPIRDPFRVDLHCHCSPVVARFALTTGYRTRRLQRRFSAARDPWAVGSTQ